MTQSLETFDFVELISMLAKGGKTGALRVYRERARFALWLSGGRVRQMVSQVTSSQDVQGAAALVDILEDPRGRFHFEEGEAAPQPDLDQSWEAFTYEALKLLPPPPLKFEGVGRLGPPEELAELNLSLHEREVLRGVAEGHPLSELARTHEAAALLGRLCRLRLIAERKLRVARLAVQVNKRLSGAVLVDEVIYRRWREAVGGHVERVEIRDERSGQVYPLPVRATSGLGTAIQMPPDLLMRTSLRAGDAVLVRPA